MIRALLGGLILYAAVRYCAPVVPWMGAGLLGLYWGLQERRPERAAAGAAGTWVLASLLFGPPAAIPPWMGGEYGDPNVFARSVTLATLVPSWQLGLAAMATGAVTTLFRRAAAWVGVVLIATILWTGANSLHTSLPRLIAREYPDYKYGVDGLEHIKTIHLMRRGFGYYDAVLEARFKRARLVPEQISGLNARWPHLFYLWSWIGPVGALILCRLLGIATVVLAFLFLRSRAGPALALVGAQLLVPWWVRFSGTLLFTWPELWAWPLVILAAWLAGLGRWRSALVAGLVAFSLRDLMALYCIALVAVGLATQRGPERRALVRPIVWVTLIALLGLALHSLNMYRIGLSNTGAVLQVRMAQWQLADLATGVYWGHPLFGGAVYLLPLLQALGLAGIIRNRDPGSLVLGIGAVLGIAAWLVLGSHRYGIVFTPALLLCAPLALSVSPTRPPGERVPSSP